MPDITLYFLQASRSIRPAWLLEELSLEYKVEFADRVNQKAPQEFKERSGNPLGKFPSLSDGDITVYESGAITEYICEKYDTSNKLLPSAQPVRSQAQIWLHAAEGTFMMHALAIMYARWNFPKEIAEDNPGVLKQLEKGLSVNVNKDFDWLEGTLAKNDGGKFILGGSQPTVADIMMEFTIDIIIERELGVSKEDAPRKWPKIDQWLKDCHACETHQKAVKKTGHTCHPKTT